MKIEIDHLFLTDVSDEDGWKSLHLSTSGDSLYEMLLMATVTAVNKDGEELFTLDLTDCDQKTKKSVHAAIEAEIYAFSRIAAAIHLEGLLSPNIRKENRVNKEQFRELVGMAIGEASMCWSEVPTGVFASDRASKIVDSLCNCFEAEQSRKNQVLDSIALAASYAVEENTDTDKEAQLRMIGDMAVKGQES